MRWQLLIGLTLLLGCQAVCGDGFGRLANNTVEDSATVCFSVGAVASLTGLDDFSLTPLGIDGSAGTRYRGSDSFHLETNAAVRVLLQAENLSNSEWQISSTFKLDGVTYFIDTPADQSHDADHELSVEASLGNISAQPAGHYQSRVTLTVVQQMRGSAGCGEVELSFGSAGETQYATLAFEDLYPQSGDADYNDFVVKYSVTESYNAQSQLENIEMNFIPLARGADYNIH